MTSPLLGAAFGLVAGAGAVLALGRLPVFRRPKLDDRLAPYLRDTASQSRLLTATPTLTPFPTLERIAGPLLADGVRLLERVLGGSASVRRRLDQAGRGQTLEQFRAEQLLWGGLAFAGALVFALVWLPTRSDVAGRPVVMLVLCGLAGVVGILARDRWLTREVTAREERMMQEFPTIAELLALAVAAGEGAIGALERVTRLSSGELARELGRALTDARSGASLVDALEGIATRTNLAPLARFVDGIAIAVERGTPLAEVLRAQAVDVREAGKRALLEAGGRKEIAMMIPVVFLVLPVTVVFALFPGFFGFSFST
jgi:tight adherence protein C